MATWRSKMVYLEEFSDLYMKEIEAWEAGL